MIRNLNKLVLMVSPSNPTKALTKNLQKNPTLIVNRCPQLASVKGKTKQLVSKTAEMLSLCKWQS